MHSTPLTIRIPSDQLQIIDLYAKQSNLSRSDIIKNCISNMTSSIKEQIQKDRLISAAEKVKKLTLKENLDFEASLEDGINDE